MPEIGDEFRTARQARHLSLSEVSEQLHIRSIYLEAIENQEWALIGAPVYVRGFIRTYARFLAIAPEPAVEYYNAVAGRAGAPAERPERTYRSRAPRRSGPSPWLWTAALAAAVLLGFVGYNFFELRAAREHRVEAAFSPAPAVATAQPVFERALGSSRPPKRPTAPQTERTLELRLIETSWLSVHIDGTRRLEGTFPAGTREAFHGKLADIRTGNAGGVELTVNGKELGTMGHSGGVVERSIPLAEE